MLCFSGNNRNVAQIIMWREWCKPDVLADRQSAPNGKKNIGNNEPFWRDLIIVCFSGIRAPSLYVLLIRIVNWGWGGWDVLEGSSGFVFSWLDAAAPT